MGVVICFHLGDGETQGWCVFQGDAARFIQALAGKGPNDLTLDEVRKAAAAEYGEAFSAAEYIGIIDAYGNCFPPCWGKDR